MAGTRSKSCCITPWKIPVSVRMDLADNGQNSHWSAEKQAALADQFLAVANCLEGNGVKQVHLVLSAQNSVAFRFGRIYDKRNLPHVKVYQFERDATPPYPWSVAMPVSGKKAAELVQTGVRTHEREAQ